MSYVALVTSVLGGPKKYESSSFNPYTKVPGGEMLSVAKTGLSSLPGPAQEG